MEIHLGLSRLVAVTILLLASNRVQCSLTVCPVNNQEFISINRELLPTSNVRATSEDTAFNPVENLITHDAQDNPPWCSAIDIGTVSGHYVEINYTEPVVITLLESSGFYNGFVSNFTIEYGSLEGDLELYTVNRSPQDFVVESLLLTDAYFTLEQPIVAQRLRFMINEAMLDTQNRICWELLMYGCKLSNGITIDPMQPQQPITTPLPDSITTSTQGPTSTGCPPAGTDGVRATAGDNMEILIIVLPVALGTIVVVIVITIVGVIVCISCTGRSKKTKE